MYSARKRLPEATECQIIDGSYNCDFKEGASQTDYDDLASIVRGCITDWRATKKDSTHIRLENPSDLAVEVEIDEHSTLTLWIHNYDE